MHDTIKTLAEKYFGGTISREEEHTLFAYVEQDDAHRAEFREWESEWESASHPDLATERAWQQFSAQTLLADGQKKEHRVSWRRISVAAAVVLLMIVSGVATWYATNAAPGHYYALTAPYGSKSRLQLPDGSVVWLNAGSTLRYSSRFGHNNRRVELSGEGYFEVAKQNGEEFVVSTSGYDVVVKGTRFDVSAYQGDPYITTTLMQGSVEICRENDHLTMKPGDMVRLDTRSGELTKTQFANDTRAWVQNMADYEEISLSDLAKILSRQYDVKVHIGSDRLSRMKFAISLRNKETIDDVLNALQRITPMNVCREGKEIYISE